MKRIFPIVHETEFYTIRKIPRNWRIDMKPSVTLVTPNTGIERDWYEWSGNLLQEAIELAERVSKEHFRPVTKAEVKLNAQKASRMRLGKRFMGKAKG